MSFSIEFTAVDKETALHEVEKAYLPDSIRDFLNHAIKELRVYADNYHRAVFVKAFGHLTSGNDYEVSSASLEVKYILIVPSIVSD